MESTMLPPSVELLNSRMLRGPFKVAVFDFDGTLSLIREGWSGIMANLGMDVLREQNLPLVQGVFERLELGMLMLSGKPSLVQMQKLAVDVAERGGQAPDPDMLLQEFLRRLYAVTDGRKARLHSGEDAPEVWAVPGSHDLLEYLKGQGVRLILASGTDRSFVHSEAELLGVKRYFGSEIYAPDDNSANFSKRDVFEKLLAEGIRGDEIISFGDGYAETVEAKRVSAAVIGLATHEAGNSGINAVKRGMLLELGADAVLSDYRDGIPFMKWLSGNA
jgi:phosphoglycolate phosphatase